MAEDGGTRIRVILRWLQIKDKLEPWFKEKGEFQFRSRVSTESEGGVVQETRFPEQGYYAISDHPRFNKLDKLNKVLFEGQVKDRLLVELFGTELDKLSADDHLEEYEREFTGDPQSWVGRYQPGDEESDAPRSDDPENLSNWRICYDIELA